MELSRKGFLRLGLAGGAGLLLPSALGGCGGLTAGNQSAEGSAGALLPSEAPLPEPFSVPLPVPPVLKPTRSDAAGDRYEIVQKVGRAEIIPGLKTEVWGYDGVFPGPTIEARSGRRTVVRHRNELPVPTAVHLHDGVTPPAHDGYPMDVVVPASGHGRSGDHAKLDRVGDGSFDYVYPTEQPAATLWYHDHRMDFTGPQVWRGLAGFHAIRRWAARS